MNHDKLVAEFSTIEETDFWKYLLLEIKKHRDTLSTMCETEEDPRKSQGGVKAIDFILGRDYLLGRSKYPNIVVRLLDETKQNPK